MKRTLISIVIAAILITGCKEQVVVGIADQVDKARSSVVHIEKVGKSQGSGCIISADGIVFTAKHVTDGGGDFIVTLDNGVKYTTSICVESKEYDVAFLKIKPDVPLIPAKMADLTSIRVGDPVFIMGSPFGSENFNSVSLGIVSHKQRNLDATQDYGFGWGITFQTDATAEPGNSGGPVFNMDGNVVGVLVAGMDATVNYSVPVGVFDEDVDTISLWFELTKFTVPEPKVYVPSFDIYQSH
jgi:S1-C subfamily serine protease